MICCFCFKEFDSIDMLIRHQRKEARSAQPVAKEILFNGALYQFKSNPNREEV